MAVFSSIQQVEKPPGTWLKRPPVTDEMIIAGMAANHEDRHRHEANHRSRSGGMTSTGSRLWCFIIGAMMRKLIHVAFGGLKSAKPFDSAIHLA
jgi:hypothetical protein